MSSIYLIRHGEIPQSRPRRFVGSRDLPLTLRGREQMEKVAVFLADKNISRLACSPLSRCRESAAIIGTRLGKSLEVAPALAEIHLGGWEGLTVSEVRTRFPGQYEARGSQIDTFRPEGGESFQDLLDRAWPFFDSLDSADDESIAVVAHSGVNRVLLCHILGMPLANLFRFEQNYGCCNIVQVHKKEYRVQLLGCCPKCSAENRDVD